MTEAHQQRRLTAIFAADVFGYSRLMAEDEEDALRTLKAHRVVIDHLITRHDGRIFSTAGDSVIAEFGSATEAVRCAITIQEELRVRNSQIDEKRRMEFRIGINVGDVMVDGDSLYGDGVNIAARLESIAAPGNICISGSVFTLVKNKLSYGFEDIGLQTMKNIPEPVLAFRLTPNLQPPRARKFQKRLAVFGGITLFMLLIGGVGTWVLSPSLFNVVISAKTEFPNGSSGDFGADGQRGVPANAAQTQLFDGLWEFKLAGGQYCPIKSLTFQRTIVGGLVVSNDGRKLGSISKDGSFKFSNPSPTNPNIIVESQGSIDGETGQGSYAGVGTPCQGTYQIRLVERLRSSQ
jgi:class 3 adenylate cyclase